MKNSNWRAIVVVALGVLTACSHRGASNAAQDDALNALKNLRDRGVLTQAEYETKVSALLGSAAPAAPAAPVSTAPETAAAVAPNPGDSGGLGGSAVSNTTPLGAPDSGSGLSGASDQFAGGAPATASRDLTSGHSAAQSKRAPRNRTLAQASPASTDSGAPATVSPPQSNAAATQPAAQSTPHANAVSNWFTQARAKTQELTSRMLHKGAPPAPTPQDAQQALQMGQDMLRNAAASDPNAANSAPSR